ncbi:hypothetical protein [Labilithrix luteola]|nr:hypothetical protein [Labilithrix luteola]
MRLHASSSAAFVALGLLASSTNAFAQEESKPAEEPAPATRAAAPAAAYEAPPSESTAPYVRHGFTMELGVGVSQTSLSSDVGDREHSNIGLAPLSLSMGGFVSPKVALLGRMAGTSFFRDDDHKRSYQTVSGFYGAGLQYWPSDRFFVGGGVGAAVLASDLYRQGSRDVRYTEVGFGGNLRAGWAFAELGNHHVFTLAIDTFASKFEKSSTLAAALNLSWQYF